MRKLATLSFVSLDGVMQSPSSAEEDPSGGFAKGGWAAPYWEDVMPQVESMAMSVPYDILFGRKTYDIFATHWPTAPKSNLSERLNAAKKYVVTSATDRLGWENSHVVSGDVVEELRKLKAQSGPLLQVHGSSELIQLLHTHELIDEYRIWTFPVVLGGGKRLFESGSVPRTLVHTASGNVMNGVSAAFYRAA